MYTGSSDLKQSYSDSSNLIGQLSFISIVTPMRALHVETLALRA